MYKTTTIDGVTVNSMTGQTYLSILDGVPWPNACPKDRLQELREKIENYVYAIKDGQILKHFPGAKIEGIAIKYVIPTLPPAYMNSFFVEMRDFLFNEEISFYIEIFDIEKYV